MVYGYVRVSTKEQNGDRQDKAIKDWASSKGLTLEDRNIITDQASGKDLDRPGYQLLTRQLLRDGDTLIVKELDRLGRDKADIKRELEYLNDLGVTVRILNIPTTLEDLPEGSAWAMDMVNNLLIEVLGTIAEEERKTIKKRQAEGIERAKAKGKHLGRPKINLDTFNKKEKEIFKQLYSDWINDNITATDFMEQVNLKRTTFYKIIKEYEATLEQ